MFNTTQQCSQLASAREFRTLIVDYASRNLSVEVPTSRLFMQVNDKDLAKELCKKYSAVSTSFVFSYNHSSSCDFSWMRVFCPSGYKIF